MPILVQYDDPSLILGAGTNAGNFAAGQDVKASNVAQQNANTNQQQVAQQGAYQQGQLAQGQQHITNQDTQFYDAEAFQRQQAQDQFERLQTEKSNENDYRLQQIAALGQNRMDYGQNVVLPQQQLRNEGTLDNTTVKSGAAIDSATIRAGATTQAAGIRADASTDNAMIHANAMTQRPSVQSNPETQGRLAGQQVIQEHNAVQRGLSFQMKAMQMDPRVSAELLDPASESSQRYQALVGKYQANEEALPAKIKSAQDDARVRAANTASATPQPPAEAQPNSPGASRQQLPNAAQTPPQPGQLVYVYNTDARRAVAGHFTGFQPGPNGQQAAMVNIPGHGPQLFDPQHVLLPGSNRMAGNGVPLQTSDDGSRATMQRDQSNVQQPLQYGPQNAATSKGNSPVTRPSQGAGSYSQADMATFRQVYQGVNAEMQGADPQSRHQEFVRRLTQMGYNPAGL